MARPLRNLMLALVLAMFLCAHSISTLVVVQVAANTPSGRAHSAAVKGLATALTLPLLLPLIRSDPDGDRFPRWFQLASVLVNSLVWCLVILLVVVIRRRSRRIARGFEVPLAGMSDGADRR